MFYYNKIFNIFCSTCFMEERVYEPFYNVARQILDGVPVEDLGAVVDSCNKRLRFHLRDGHVVRPVCEEGVPNSPKAKIVFGVVSKENQILYGKDQGLFYDNENHRFSSRVIAGNLIDKYLNS